MDNFSIKFKIPEELSKRLRESQNYQKNQNNSVQSTSTLTYLGEKARKTAVQDTPKCANENLESWEALSAVEEIALSSLLPNLENGKVSVKVDEEPRTVNGDWETFPDFAVPGDEPVLLVNLRQLYGGPLPHDQIEAFTDQIHQTIHADFVKRSAELFELDQLCYHCTTGDASTLKEELEHETGDIYAPIYYPRIIQGHRLEHLWWKVLRPSKVKPVEAIKELLRQTNQDLMWKVLVTEELEALSLEERAATWEWQCTRFQKQKEQHVAKLEEVMTLFEERLREAKQEAFSEEIRLGAARPVTEALILQIQAKLDQIYQLIEELDQPDELEPTLSDFDSDNWETDTETASESSSENPSDYAENHSAESDSGKPVAEELSQLSSHTPKVKQKTKRLRRKLNFKVPVICPEQASTKDQFEGCLDEKNPKDVTEPSSIQTLSIAALPVCPASEQKSSSICGGTPSDIKFIPAWKKKKSQEMSEKLVREKSEENGDQVHQNSNSLNTPANTKINSPEKQELPCSSLHDDEHSYSASSNEENHISIEKMTLLDRLVAMILVRYPKMPSVPAEHHFSWIAESHAEIQRCWLQEFGRLPSI